MTDEDVAVLVSAIKAIAGRKNISQSSRLYHDLGIAGDDAYELLETLHKKFGVKFDQLDFGRYFPNETDAGIFHIAKLFGFKGRWREMTVRDLIESIDRGAWIAS
jgi:hypothetical protein